MRAPESLELGDLDAPGGKATKAKAKDFKERATGVASGDTRGSIAFEI